jgi:geranylgeranyl pyrophosphate synthase
MQFLPEIKNVFERFRLEEEKMAIEEEFESKDWHSFLFITESIDQLVEKQKRKVIEESPYFLRKPVMDGISAKKNNDRSWCGYVSCIAAGGNSEKYIDIFLAFELLDFSIIMIDDMLDKAEKRAAKPAHYLKWGNATTLSTSEFLKSVSSNLLLQAPIGDKKKLSILRELQLMQQKVYEGQELDLQLEKKDISDVTLEDYTKLVSLTTGYQGRTLFRVGGILANVSNKDVDLLGNIGMDLGILSQMRDDLIDYIPDEDLTWKTSFLDFRRRKKRIPLIIGWNNATPQERERLTELEGKQKFTPEDYVLLTSILFKPENLKEIEKTMQRFKKAGIEKIKKGKFTSEGKNYLISVFRFEVGEKI